MINEKLRSSLGLEQLYEYDTETHDYSSLALAVSNEMRQFDAYVAEIDKDLETVNGLINDYVSLESLYSTTADCKELNETSTKLLSISVENVGRKYGISADDLVVSSEGILSFMTDIIKAVIKKIKNIISKALEFGRKAKGKIFNPTKAYAKSVYKLSKNVDKHGLYGEPIYGTGFALLIGKEDGSMYSVDEYKASMDSIVEALESPIMRIDSSFYEDWFENLLTSSEFGSDDDGGQYMAGKVIESEMDAWSRYGFVKQSNGNKFYYEDGKIPTAYSLISVAIEGVPSNETLGWGVTADTAGNLNLEEGIFGGILIEGSTEPFKLDKKPVPPLGISDAREACNYIDKLCSRVVSIEPVTKKESDKLIKKLTTTLEETIAANTTDEQSAAVNKAKVLMRLMVSFVAIRHKVFTQGCKLINKINFSYINYCSSSIGLYKMEIETR